MALIEASKCLKVTKWKPGDNQSWPVGFMQQPINHFLALLPPFLYKRTSRCSWPTPVWHCLIRINFCSNKLLKLFYMPQFLFEPSWHLSCRPTSPRVFHNGSAFSLTVPLQPEMQEYRASSKLCLQSCSNREKPECTEIERGRERMREEGKS